MNKIQLPKRVNIQTKLSAWRYVFQKLDELEARIQTLEIQNELTD